ncbi:MAG: hypothetical protein Q7K54_05220 [Candidatus Parcubacteria bacterium]|nr:hypothetical protein [Candidatus Parcubacteria bacterium]
MAVEVLKSKIQNILQVISETCSMFHLSPTIPAESVLLSFIEQNRGLGLKLADGFFIIFSDGIIGNSVKVKLCALAKTFSEKREWEQQMKTMFSTAGFDFTSSGLAPSEKFMDLMKGDEEQGEVITPEPSFIQSTHSQEESKPEPQPPRKTVVLEKKQKTINECPRCNKKITSDEKENMHCDGCDEDFWLCPRCNQYITEDPDDSDTEKCPKCDKTLRTVECPECKKDIFADLTQCPECNAVFTMGKCPHCNEDILVSENLSGEDCPYCNNNIWLCPRCNQYLDEDPDDLTECPKCEKILEKVKLP